MAALNRSRSARLFRQFFGKVLTASSDGTARVWDVSPIRADLHTLTEQAQLFSAHRLAENHSTVPLDPEDLKRLWNAYRSR